ncbi:hypothetical protein TNCV_2979731 [Trichonephila clavipes]|nr:hypothetical protein TNCV_2979731 [Trichonephila clavipes]
MCDERRISVYGGQHHRASIVNEGLQSEDIPPVKLAFLCREHYAVYIHMCTPKILHDPEIPPTTDRHENNIWTPPASRAWREIRNVRGDRPTSREWREQTA